MTRRRKKGSSTDIAVRVRRRDGRPMKRSEAEQVMAYFRRHKHPPRAYEVRGVVWSRGGKEKGRGSLADLRGSGLARVLDATAENEGAWSLRLGSVK